MRYMFYLILLIASGSSSTGCKDDNSSNCNLPKGYGEYLVIDAVKQMIEQKILSFKVGDYDENSITVHQLLSNSDTTKIFSIIVVYDNHAQRNKYFSTSIIGSREHNGKQWSFTEFQMILSNNIDPISSANTLCQYYNNDIKGDWQVKKKYKFTHTATEIEFWDSLFFQKGIDVDSLYYYQTDYNTYTHKHDIIKPMVTCIMR